MAIRTSEMCFLMKQYPVVCDDVTYNVNSDEKVARVNDMPDSSTEEVRHLSATSSEARTANLKFY